MNMATLKDLIETSFTFVDLADEQKSEMINKLADIAVERTIIRALEKMNDEEVTSFEDLMAKNQDPQSLFGYLETVVPSFYDMLKEEVFRLQDIAEQSSDTDSNLI
jgi:hypothetical protein